MSERTISKRDLTKIEVNDRLDSKIMKQVRLGVSKQLYKKDKKDMFDRVKFIHSVGTIDNYKQVARQFSNWREKQGFGKYTKNEDLLKEQAVQYLEYREKKGYVPSTLQRDSSALNRIFFADGSERLNYIPPPVKSKDIFKGRTNKPINPITDYTKDAYLIAQATGVRRDELISLERRDFKEINGRLFVNVKNGKGGKERTVPVLGKYEQEVRDILNKQYLEGRSETDKLLERGLNSKHNIHRLRREYSKDIAQEIKDKPVFQKDLENFWGKRTDVVKKERNIKSDVYRARSGIVENRDVVYLTSRALGHNRLDVVMLHYFT